MNENTPKKEAWWHRLERGQAMAEYWPTIPAAIAVMIAAAAIVAPLRWTYQTTADVLNGCEIIQHGPTTATFDGGHQIEVTSSSYDGTDTTVVFHVSSASQPSISHWMLGIDKSTADKIVYASESYEGMFDNPDPTTGAYGIKFDTGYDGGSSGGGGKGGGKGPKLSRMLIDYRPRMNTYVEERDIALTFSGYVDFVTYLPVTVKAGVDEISSSTISVPSSSRDIVRCEDK